jgi:hypothetical protein
MKEEKNQPVEKVEKSYETPKIEEHSIVDKASDCSAFVAGFNSDTLTYWF